MKTLPAPFGALLLLASEQTANAESALTGSETFSAEHCAGDYVCDEEGSAPVADPSRNVLDQASTIEAVVTAPKRISTSGTPTPANLLHQNRDERTRIILSSLAFAALIAAQALEVLFAKSCADYSAVEPRSRSPWANCTSPHRILATAFVPVPPSVNG